MGLLRWAGASSLGAGSLGVDQNLTVGQPRLHQRLCLAPSRRTSAPVRTPRRNGKTAATGKKGISVRGCGTPRAETRWHGRYLADNVRPFLIRSPRTAEGQAWAGWGWAGVAARSYPPASLPRSTHSATLSTPTRSRARCLLSPAHAGACPGTCWVRMRRSPNALPWLSHAWQTEPRGRFSGSVWWLRIGCQNRIFSQAGSYVNQMQPENREQMQNIGVELVACATAGSEWATPSWPSKKPSERVDRVAGSIDEALKPVP
jgi:hypothetical protein